MSTWDEMMEDYCNGKSNNVNAWDFGPYSEAATPEESDSKNEEIIETVETPVEEVCTVADKKHIVEEMPVEVPAKVETETTVKAVKVKKANTTTVNTMSAETEVKAEPVLEGNTLTAKDEPAKVEVKAKSNPEIDNKINELLIGVKNSKASRNPGIKVNTANKKK